MEFELLFTEHGPEAAQCDADNLVDDLRLDVLLYVMSGGDDKISDICRQVMVNPLEDEEKIYKRRAVLHDALNNTDTFARMLSSSGKAVEGFKSHAEFQKPKYDKIISTSNKIITEADIAKLHIKYLRNLYSILQLNPNTFSSKAMLKLYRLINEKCRDDILSRIEKRINQLEKLKSSGELSISCNIGPGLKQSEIILNDLSDMDAGKRKRSKSTKISISLSSTALVRNADEITQSVLAPIYRSINDFNKELKLFFEKLNFQLCFFVGCANLLQKLKELEIPICEPVIASKAEKYSARTLMDTSLALKKNTLPTGNDFNFTGKELIIITGPNQGGKTTFLRAVGIAQLMAQCGMFVTASSYSSRVFKGIFTHFPSREDPTLKMGLLEVELNKFSGIIDRIKPGSLLLMNESFQTTMPLDAKQIAGEIVTALNDAGVVVGFVTHLYAYSSDLYHRHREDILFLLAQRDSSGKNTYLLQNGEPYKSAFGMELFSNIIDCDQSPNINNSLWT